MISKANAEKYCAEDISLIENYKEAVSSKELYHCHHRLEIQDDKCYFAKELKQMNLYYGRPANELIFLKAREHKDLHFDYSEKCYKAVLNKYKEKGVGYSDFCYFMCYFMCSFIHGDDAKDRDDAKVIDEAKVRDEAKELYIKQRKQVYIDMIKDIEDGGIDNIKDDDIDFLAYRLGIINKEERRDFDFYKHSPYGRIPKKIQEDLKNKIKLVIDDNLMELIEEKEQLIKELETSKRSNSIFF